MLGIVDAQLECEASHVEFIEEYLLEALAEVSFELLDLGFEFGLHSSFEEVDLVLRLGHGFDQGWKVAPNPQLVHVLIVLENELIEITLFALNYLLLNHLAVRLHLRLKLYISFLNALNQIVVGKKF